MTENERLILEMKRKAGLATPAEIEVLDSAWVRRGENGGLLVPPPAASVEQWVANVEAGVYGPNTFAPIDLSRKPPPDYLTAKPGDVVIDLRLEH